MPREYCLVEVNMRKFEPGDKWYQGWFEMEIDFATESWEEATKEFEKKDSWPWVVYDVEIIKPITTFNFSFMGQHAGDFGYANGLEWEVANIGTAEVFEGWEKDLEEIGSSIIQNYEKRGRDFGRKFVRFITLWTYDGYQDSYNGEFDSEWDLVGVVDPADIFKMLKEKENGTTKG